MYAWLRKKNRDGFKFKFKNNSKPDIEYTIIVQAFLILKKVKKGEREKVVVWYSYASNLDLNIKYIAEMYRKRWGIETHYRIFNKFRIFTCSRSASFRVLVFGLSMVFDMLWLIFNALLNRINDRKIKSWHDSKQLFAYSSDKLLITVKRFLRNLREILSEMGGI